MLFRVINELKLRFNEYLKTGDDSRIPPDLERVTFRMVSSRIVLLYAPEQAHTWL